MGCKSSCKREAFALGARGGAGGNLRSQQKFGTDTQSRHCFGKHSGLFSVRV